MTKAEDRIDAIERATDAAVEALAFSQVLQDLLVTQRLMPPSDTVDYVAIEKAITRLNGELVAACLFLGSDHFVNVPKLLRDISNRISSLDADNKTVPPEVVAGYRYIADRIEHLRGNSATPPDFGVPEL